MLDNAVLKEVAAKTGEACRSSKGCRGCSAALRHQRASGLFHPWRGSIVDARLIYWKRVGKLQFRLRPSSRRSAIPGE
jgi:hypothetical protein